MEARDYLNSKGIKAKAVFWEPGTTWIHFEGSVETIHHETWMPVERVVEIYADQSNPMPGNAEWVIRIDQGATILDNR